MVKFVLPLHFQSFELAFWSGAIYRRFNNIWMLWLMTEWEQRETFFLNLSLSLHFACPVSPSWMTHWLMWEASSLSKWLNCLYCLSEAFRYFIEGRHGAKSNKYFAQDESHPDLIISPMIANLQTPLKIDIKVYLHRWSSWVCSITSLTSSESVRESSVSSESPGGANLPSLPPAHTWLLGERGINERRGGVFTGTVTSWLRREAWCEVSGDSGGWSRCSCAAEPVSLWPLGSTCCLLTPETHPLSQLTGHNRLAHGFYLGFLRLSLGTCTG